MIQESELIQLVVVAVFAPLVILSLRRLAMPSKPYIAAGMMALTLAYIFTVLEGFAAHDLFNVLEHAMLALSGVMFGVSAWVGLKYWHRRENAGR